MKHIEHSAIVLFSTQQMYDIVNNIENYPNFLPWCSSAAVLEQTENHLIGELEVAKGGFKKRFTTRNSLHPYESMRLDCIDGPFSHFHAIWQFHALEKQACKVIFSMHYAFSNKLIDLMASPIFQQIGDSMVDAFVKHARELYREN